MEAVPLRAGRAQCVSNIQQDMVEQTLAIIASMMQQAAHDATLYCAEAKRKVIMPRDIELALKRLVLPGSAYWTRDNLPGATCPAIWIMCARRVPGRRLSLSKLGSAGQSQYSIRALDSSMGTLITLTLPPLQHSVTP